MRTKLCVLRKPSRASVNYVPAVRMVYDSKANVYRDSNSNSARVFPSDQLPLGTIVLKISGVNFEMKHRRNMNLIMYDGSFFVVSSGWLRSINTSENAK